jgi:hypothetical protein
MEKQLGPSSLKHRIDSLDGDLILVSNLSGSRLEISLPLVQQGRAPVSSAPATGTSL